LVLALATDHRRAQAVIQGNLGSLATQEGRIREADERLQIALELCRELGLPREEGYAMLDFGHLAHARGEKELARSRFGEAKAVFVRVGVPEGQAQAALAIGRVFLERDELDEAADQLREAEELTLRHSLGDPGPLPRAYLSLLGSSAPDSVAVDDNAPAEIRAETHLVLHRAGAGGNQLRRAREILEAMSAHLEGEDRRGFWERNLVAKAVVAEEMDVPP
jgi:hypothetical protein